MRIRTSLSGSDRSPRYGGRLFSAASALPLDSGLICRGRLVWLFAAALRRPWRMAAVILTLLRTKSLDIRLSDSVPGRALRAYFNQRSVGLFPHNRLCRGVLVLPRHHSDYLRGRRRQVVRTNLRKAAAMGISCGPTHDRSLALDHVRRVLTDRDGSMTEADAIAWRPHIAQPEVTFVVARNARGRPLALAGVVIDDEICLIRFAVACSHEARWALHDYLVRILIARGISYLVAEGGGPFGALGFASKVQHYQHLLGYELRHVTPDTTLLWRRWRVLAAIAITLTTGAALLVQAALAAT